jgi:holo-[acyl-carrier protein] synthase
MIYGIGNDIIEVDRIKRAIERDNGFKEKVFSLAEIEVCESKANKYQSYAARFAAKEAFMKAFGSGWAEGIAWNEIEVLSQDNGKPYLNLLNKTKKIINQEHEFILHVSLSHLKEYAIANVILER